MQTELRKIILHKLQAHSELNVERVRVKIQNNSVELSGEADGEDALATIEAIVRNIPGVADVINLMHVHIGSTTGVQGLRIN
jgi:osmotically-inducible protein OsmY